MAVVSLPEETVVHLIEEFIAVIEKRGKILLSRQEPTINSSVHQGLLVKMCMTDLEKLQWLKYLTTF